MVDSDATPQYVSAAGHDAEFGCSTLEHWRDLGLKQSPVVPTLQSQGFVLGLRHMTASLAHTRPAPGAQARHSPSADMHGELGHRSSHVVSSHRSPVKAALHSHRNQDGAVKSSTQVPPLRQEVGVHWLTGEHVWPSPWKPGSHAHEKLPTVLLHFAFASHVCWPVVHSFTSKHTPVHTDALKPSSQSHR